MSNYDARAHSIGGVDPVDAVTSLAVLCHTSDPLYHLSELSRLARKALFVWTIVSDDDRYIIHFGEPRGDYPEDSFPICFDNLVCPSFALLRRSLELMGFRHIVELPRDRRDLPMYEWKGFKFRGLLGVR